ncbi:MAG: hypothetical protein ACUVQ1_02790 [Candidatus Kapaibacteriales bacterium]
MVYRLIFFSLSIFVYQTFYQFMLFSETYRKNLFLIRSFSPTLGFPINQISYEFFDSYNSISSLSADEFTFHNIPSCLLDIELYNEIRIPFSIEIQSLEFFNSFSIKKDYFDKTIVETFSETFLFKFYPVSLYYYWYPILSDYRSFFLFQVGVSIDKIVWKEKVESNSPYEQLNKAMEKSWKQFNPYGSFAAGVELPFDKNSDTTQMLESLLFACKFNFAYRKGNFFSQFSIQNPVVKRVSVLPFSMVFMIGFRLNIYSLFHN